MRKKRQNSPPDLIAATRRRLADEVGHDKVADLEGLARRLRILEELERHRWRRRSILWLALTVAIAVAVALILQFAFHLKRADVVVVATTRALELVTGPTEVGVLPSEAPSSEIVVWGRLPHHWCSGSRTPVPITCEVVGALRLTALFLNPHSSARLRAVGPCFETRIVGREGSGYAFVTFDSAAVSDPRAPSGELFKVELTPTDSITLCPTEDTVVRVVGLSSLTIGYTSDDRDAAPDDFPALLDGTLTIATTGKSLTLKKTDVPWVGGVKGGSLLARLHDPIEVAFVGTASHLSLVTGSQGPHGLMPSWLDWIRGSPASKAAIAVLASIVGAAIALRGRLLDEIA
jgi:hypothetical protein